MSTRKNSLPGVRRRSPIVAPVREPTAAEPARDAATPAAAADTATLETPASLWFYITCGVILLGAFLFSYWHTLAEMVATWEREPDYSHGYLVAPLSIWFLWIRRDRWPGISRRWAWVGLLILAFATAQRIYGMAIASSLDGWSILPWAFGAAWTLFGPRVAIWSLPSIFFLAFMVPVPFSAESLLSVPLQRIATTLSVAALQFFGQPAIAEGNVILLGDHRLEVAQACSGLRIFVGIVALAFAYLIAFRRVWWQKLAILASILPIALIANATRIVATGFLYQYASGKTAQQFSHDFAGWLMIPWAAALFGLLLLYLDRLFIQEILVDNRNVMGREPDSLSDGLNGISAQP